MPTQERKIITFLEVTDRPISPKEIAKETRINPNSVRSVLSKLLSRGEIIKDFYGHYSISPTHGMGEFLPRVQNLFVVSEDFDRYDRIPRGMRDVLIPLEDEAQIRLLFGSKRNKVSWSVKAPKGLDLYGLQLCRRVVDDAVRTRGFKNVNWMVKNFELLQDMENIRLEGLKSVTIDGLTGVLEKYYNKGAGFRREVRASIPTPVENILALARGGIPTYQVIQGVGLVAKKIDDSVEVQKNTNRLLVDLTKVVGALADAQLRMQDSIGSFLSSLKGDKDV